MSLSGVFCHAFQPLFLPQLKTWEVVSQPVKELNNGDANDFDRPSCWCGICTFSNKLRARTTMSLSLLVFCDPDILHGPGAEIYMYVCSLCLVAGLSVFISIFNCLSTQYLASRLLMQEKISLLLSTWFRYDCQSLLGVLSSLFGSSCVRTPVQRRFWVSDLSFFRVCVPDCIGTLHCRRQLIL